MRFLDHAADFLFNNLPVAAARRAVIHHHVDLEYAHFAVNPSRLALRRRTAVAVREIQHAADLRVRALAQLFRQSNIAAAHANRVRVIRNAFLDRRLDLRGRHIRLQNRRIQISCDFHPSFLHMYKYLQHNHTADR